MTLWTGHRPVRLHTPLSSSLQVHCHGIRAPDRRHHRLESRHLVLWPAGLSSHTLIGSIIGVGITNALMHGRDGTSGVDWTKATEIGYALLLSPLFASA